MADPKGHSGIGVRGAVGFLLYLVVFPIALFVLASEVRQGQLNDHWRSLGARS
ncbi:MAG: hypothetical protein ABJA87_12640 [bacterium]